MMRQKSKFPFAYHPDVKLKVTSMFLVLRKLVRQNQFNVSHFTKTLLLNSFVQVLELPYEGGDISMIILLPDDIEDDTTGLEKVRHLEDLSGICLYYPTNRLKSLWRP